MESTVQGIGLASLMALACAVAGYVVLCRLGRRILGGIFLGSVPDRITLRPIAEPAFQDPAASLALGRRLAELGFASAGAYAIPEQRDMPLLAYVKPAEGFLAVVYDHPKAGPTLDVTARYQGGSAVCATTSPPSGLDGMPGVTRISEPGADAALLLQLMAMARPRTPVRPVKATDFVSRFEEAWEEETRWRKRRGLTLRELRAQMAASAASPGPVAWEESQKDAGAFGLEGEPVLQGE